MPPTLTARERAHLKARAHALSPIVHIGQAGLTDAVVSELERTLLAHELIKVRVDAPNRDDREALGTEAASRVDAAAVQRVGKVLVLWRPRPVDESDVP